jgi:predicted DNA-binding transcriptional regulator AlpA
MPPPVLPTCPFLTWKELGPLIKYSRSYVWRLEQKNAFPPRRRFGPNRTVWVTEEVNEWINKKIAR